MSTLARHRSPVGPWQRAAAELLAAVLPVGCAGCGARDVECCPRCASFLGDPPATWEVLAGRHPAGLADLAGYALCRYDGALTTLLTAWKDRGRADLTPWIGAGLARAAIPLLGSGSLGAAALLSTAGGVADPRRADPRRALGPVVLVPVPTSAGAVRRRGADLLRQAVDQAAARLRARGLRAECRPLLSHVRTVADQSGLTAQQRTGNVRGAYRAQRRGSAGSPDATPAGYLLVDDVVTTGATLAEARHALSQAGIAVDAAVTLAATAHHASTGRGS